MYMLTPPAGWEIVPDYLAIFKPSSYHWLIPALNNPSEASQQTVTLGALLFAAIAVCESVPGIHRHANWPTRAGIYFCAAVIFYVSVSGVASVAMESMLRYEFCVHALIVLALLNPLGQFQRMAVFLRALGIAAVALVCAAWTECARLVSLEFYSPAALDRVTRMKTSVAIRGAGPAGLTAGYLLSKRTESRSPSWKPIRCPSGVFRALSPTRVSLRHRLAIVSSPSPRQSKISGLKFYQTTCWFGPVHRAFLQRQVFPYPLKPFEALINLGVLKSGLCVLSWLKARLFPVPRSAQFRGMGHQSVRQTPFQHLL